jgi:hypothetical protein
MIDLLKEQGRGSSNRRERLLGGLVVVQVALPVIIVALLRLK